MESYQNYIASSDNAGNQISSGKRAEPISAVEAFAECSSKKDLYDHMSNNLQVSFNFITAKMYLVLYAIIRDVHEGFCKRNF